MFCRGDNENSNLLDLANHLERGHACDLMILITAAPLYLNRGNTLKGYHRRLTSPRRVIGRGAFGREFRVGIARFGRELLKL
jgi:hypothetical protein